MMGFTTEFVPDALREDEIAERNDSYIYMHYILNIDSEIQYQVLRHIGLGVGSQAWGDYRRSSIK